jgi:F-type H+-transporting ATPase subunit b
MELLKLLNANELVSQIVCFLILLAIMRVFLWKKFLGIIDKRREAVSSEFKNIDAMKASILLIKTEYEARLADIDDEARVRIQEATAEARKIAQEIHLKAEDDGEKLLENARANLKDEVAKAKEELKNEVVDLTIHIAEKVIQEKLSEKSDRRLVEDFIEGIGKK